MARCNLVKTGGGGSTRYELNKEKFTGEYWIDGNKIYKKTLYSSSVTNNLVLGSIPEIESYIYSIGNVTRSDTDVTYSLPFVLSTARVSVGIDLETGKVSITYGGDTDCKDLYVTIFYTKNN